MELTPKTLREVEFREKMRGYNAADVDSFLEEAAVAVDILLARLRAAEAATSPVAAAVAHEETRAVSLGEDAVGHVLLVAQFSADQAVVEAEELARIMHAEALAEADRLLTEAKITAEGRSEAARSAARADLVELDELRLNLETEIASVRSWVARFREALSGALSQPSWSQSEAPGQVPILDLAAVEPTVDIGGAEWEHGQRSARLS